MAVYVPTASPRAGGRLPVVVLADGQGLAGFAGIAQRLIEEGKIRPVIIVGIHSGGYRGQPNEPHDVKNDFRAREYLAGLDPERFALHARFVREEVLPLVRRAYPASARRDETAVAGFSNGGAWAASMGIKFGAEFGWAFPMSIGMTPEDPQPAGPLPRFTFSAGRLEPGFLRGTQATRDKVLGWGGDAVMIETVSGHDPARWQMAFSLALQRAFPAEAR